MKTIKYRFIPLEERSDEELSQLCESLRIVYYDYRNLEDRKKILKLLSKKSQEVKQFEVLKLAISAVGKTQNKASSINCGELGILRIWFSDVWRHEWVENDFDFLLEVE